MTMLYDGVYQDTSWGLSHEHRPGLMLKCAEAVFDCSPKLSDPESVEFIPAPLLLTKLVVSFMNTVICKRYGGGVIPLCAYNCCPYVHSYVVISSKGWAPP